jgi:phosphate transport system permease protein
LTLIGRLKVYASRWIEFLTAEPREANTEGGVLPAIFGTFVMTVLLAVAVAPFGIMAALYLREYARQGRLVSLVRICVNNLAGVPSIVYGVFGLGFFAYILGGTIDQLFFPERLPNPTFGSGGLLWASLTLAMLTVPVVIVSTEEALAVPSRCGGSPGPAEPQMANHQEHCASRAMPGIMTGLILAMARGAGEVALMLVGVVKIA